jgi:alkylhydroperoxidase family enzyme
MFLRDVENKPAAGSGFKAQVQALKESGIEVPQLLHIFAYKPELAKALGEFSEVIMRGSSPLSPGLRELIAAFTSAQNRCVF